ncbi:hypothetical protein M011DRAFT_174085 [Sporormia fimetaria CBS 119925]|uniref:Uncharacterized protein n=1 Tax=Sporormia fimetaria CBS 119925 TaxID=1340428 RepID=A0A6A6VIW0_9PLEO|nr:hypothetical protein M011DRAFT_174085 [Sporormia fimetaria CBS 119925]
MDCTGWSLSGRIITPFLLLRLASCTISLAFSLTSSTSLLTLTLIPNTSSWSLNPNICLLQLPGQLIISVNLAPPRYQTASPARSEPITVGQPTPVAAASWHSHPDHPQYRHARQGSAHSHHQPHFRILVKRAGQRSTSRQHSPSFKQS